MQKDERRQKNVNRTTVIKLYIRKKFAIRPPVNEDPRLYSPRFKSLIVACVSLVACTGGFTSTIYFPGIPLITEELRAPDIATTLTAALFALFTGIAPVVWASISEFFHVRRFIFLIAMTIFMVTSLGAVFVHNIWVLVVVRCLQSIGVSSGQSIGAGYIADLYPIEQRGRAFGQYMLGIITGPLIGPLLGGLLLMSPTTWRATFWFCFAFALFILCITFFITPETYRDSAKFDLQLPTARTATNMTTTTTVTIANNNTQGEKAPTHTYNSVKMESNSNTVQNVTEIKSSSSSIITTNDNDNVDSDITFSNRKRQIVTPAVSKPFNPFVSFWLLRHPFVIMSAITSGLFFGGMFAIETILPNAFRENYGFNSWQIGLSYLGAGIGNIFGSLVGGRLSDRLLLRSRRLRGGAAKCEDRITANIWVAGVICVPLGLLLFGWIVEKKLSVWGAIIAFGVQCFGNVQVITATTAYLVDSVPGRGASATAAANFVRFLFACILSIIATPMVATLGAGWTCTLFAGLSWLGMGITAVLKIWGEPMRQRSGY
ncbi:major facilitator superfamily domain-containing protein [Mycotypha africana]|uniref:major facilitator superfamily domain-containing protein n=1 Tax=Mycotypha africana TaxID=64632 RepID=UPI002300F9C0|nr:major facilitator superfamily domain-containing protein [Mycotypha africana]KAI8984509.1 major facilitator superfamily domain-containing protein [Mycotypha africana]